MKRKATDTSEETRELTPMFDFRRRLARSHPGFSEVLSRKRHLGGWSHNVFQHPGTADARATEIADAWVKRFNDVIGKYGILPFTGVEVNVPLIVHNKAVNPDSIFIINRIHKLHNAMADVMREQIGKEHPTRVLKKLNLKPEKNPLTGRTYDDHGELEIATPAQSPMATITRVNQEKRIMYEASHSYVRDYQKSPEGKLNPDEDPPCSPSTQLLVEGLDTFDIKYAFNRGTTGEHYNLSLIARDLDGHIDYHNAKNNLYEFNERNLFCTKSWQKCFSTILEHYLADCDLMAYGGPNQKWDKGEIRPTHSIRSHLALDHESPFDNRLEIRTFNDGSSNISLTTLAIMSIVFGILKTMDDDPELRHKYLENHEPITKEDTSRIMRLMEYSLNYAPNPNITGRLDRKRDRFGKCIALRMMDEYVFDIAKREDRESLGAEVDDLYGAVMQRSFDLQGPSKHR